MNKWPTSFVSSWFVNKNWFKVFVFESFISILQQKLIAFFSFFDLNMVSLPRICLNLYGKTLIQGWKLNRINHQINDRPPLFHLDSGTFCWHLINSLLDICTLLKALYYTVVLLHYFWSLDLLEAIQGIAFHQWQTFLVPFTQF